MNQSVLERDLIKLIHVLFVVDQISASIVNSGGSNLQVLRNKANNLSKEAEKYCNMYYDGHNKLADQECGEFMESVDDHIRMLRNGIHKLLEMNDKAHKIQALYPMITTIANKSPEEAYQVVDALEPLLKKASEEEVTEIYFTEQYDLDTCDYDIHIYTINNSNKPFCIKKIEGTFSGDIEEYRNLRNKLLTEWAQAAFPSQIEEINFLKL